MNIEIQETYITKFEEAWNKWENESDSSHVIALFADHDWLEVQASPQKGCDCTAIEVNGHYGCAYDQDASWDATGKFLSAIENEYDSFTLSFDKGMGWMLDLPDWETIIGPTALYVAMAAAYADYNGKPKLNFGVGQ